MSSTDMLDRSLKEKQRKLVCAKEKLQSHHHQEGTV